MEGRTFERLKELSHKMWDNEDEIPALVPQVLGLVEKEGLVEGLVSATSGDKPYYSVVYIGDGHGRVVAFPGFEYSSIHGGVFNDLTVGASSWASNEEARRAAQWGSLLERFQEALESEDNSIIELSREEKEGTTQYGDPILLYQRIEYKWTKRPDLIFIYEYEVTCRSSMWLDLGTCRCVSHDPTREGWIVKKI